MFFGNFLFSFFSLFFSFVFFICSISWSAVRPSPLYECVPIHPNSVRIICIFSLLTFLFSFISLASSLRAFSYCIKSVSCGGLIAANTSSSAIPSFSASFFKNSSNALGRSNNPLILLFLQIVSLSFPFFLLQIGFLFYLLLFSHRNFVSSHFLF